MTACPYCRTSEDGAHAFDCVTVKKTVRVRATVEYPLQVPAHWDDDMVKFSLNESSRCADQLIDDLRALITDETCLCDYVVHEVVSDEV